MARVTSLIARDAVAAAGANQGLDPAAVAHLGVLVDRVDDPVEGPGPRAERARIGR